MSLANVILLSGSDNVAVANGRIEAGTILPGGAAAGLYSLVGAEELLELGWRACAGVMQWTR